MALRPMRSFLKISNTAYLYAEEKETSVRDQSSKAGAHTFHILIEHFLCAGRG